MTSLNRPLSGRALHYRLVAASGDGLIDAQALENGGRTARTLVKEGPLRVTLVALAPGGSLAEHHADGPITVHVLEGQVHVRAGEDTWPLEEGDLLSVGAGVPHSVESAPGGVFLLTVASLGGL